MEDRQLLLLKILSFFLQYPQEDDFLIFDPAELPQAVMSDTLKTFWAYRKERPLLEIQEEYTRTFDLNPATSLNLSCHLPNADSRGKLLLELQQIFQDAGYKNLPGELPDYLPLILEFMSVCPEQHSRLISQEYAPVVKLLALRLNQAGSSYAGIVDSAGRILSELAERRDAVV